MWRFEQVFYIILIQIININNNNHNGVLSQFIGVNEMCETESGKTGNCLPIQECPIASDLIKDKIQPKICGYKGFNVIVCCQNEETLNRINDKPGFTTDTTTISEDLLVSTGKIGDKSLRACKSYEYLSQNIIRDRFGNEIVKNICPWSSNEEFLIVGSDKSSHGEFPHVAMIGYDDKTGTYTWFCAGALVSEKFVLTTAHCIYANETEPNFVRLGDLNFTNSEDDKHVQQIDIKRLLLHPKYEYPRMYNDIGLIELEKSVNINLFVKPACLYLEEPVGTIAEAIHTGWGLPSPNGVKNEILIKTIVDLHAWDTCDWFYGDYRLKLPNGFDPNALSCYGFTNNDALCRGMFGDPVQIESLVDCSYELLGLTVFGLSCDYKSAPAAMIKIYPYIDWIESMVWP